jgi:hypothetical protein
VIFSRLCLPGFAEDLATADPDVVWHGHPDLAAAHPHVMYTATTKGAQGRAFEIATFTYGGPEPGQCSATRALSSAARKPFARFTASSLAQKWQKNRRGCSSSMWL